MNQPQRHAITRVRREPRRRSVTVASTLQLTPLMRRICFVSDDLRDFESAAPDDHVKLFVPGAVERDGRPVMRNYTPRAFDNAAGTLTIDFVLHDAGPATAWASRAQIGDVLEIGGPRGSNIVADDFAWYLLIGDESAIPAIARRLEELRAGVFVRCLLVVDGPKEVQHLRSNADATIEWLQRDTSDIDDVAHILSALAARPVRPGDGYTFVAGEAAFAQEIRSHLLDRGHRAEWLKASGYWTSDGARDPTAPDKVGHRHRLIA